MAEEHLAKLSANPHLRALARERERNEVGRRITMLAEREEGRQEGRHQGSLVLFQRMVEQRLSPLSESQRARVLAFSEAELDAATAAIFEASSVEDFLLRATGEG